MTPPWSLNTNSPALWLLLYFAFNLSLTLYNKSVLIHFPFPYTLTAIHALCGSIGTLLLLRFQHAGWRAVLGLAHSRRRSPDRQWGPGVPRLAPREALVLFLFSILYTTNIVVSNASLRLVTVPFHQVVRAATPFFTLLFSAIILRNNFKCTTRKALCLVPVVAGVAFATYGDYYFTTLGFLLTLLGTVLAALKTIITHLILVKPARTSPDEKVPTLPLHSPVGKTVPLPSPSSTSFSEKDCVYHRHRPLSTSPRASSPLDSSPPAYTFPSLPSSSHLLAPAHDYPPPPSPSPPPPQSRIPKLKLTPLQLLYLLSPLAFIQTTLLAHFTGELDRVRLYLATLSAGSGGAVAADAAIALSGAGATYLTRIGEWIHLGGLGGFQLPLSPDLTTNDHVHIQGATTGGNTAWGGVDFRVWLLLNGIMAFWLNVVSFNANRRVGALGMTVAANVKQVLTIALGVVIFDLTITRENAVGVVLTVLGGAGYAFVEFWERGREAERVRRGE